MVLNLIRLEKDQNMHLKLQIILKIYFVLKLILYKEECKQNDRLIHYNLLTKCWDKLSYIINKLNEFL